LKAAHVFDSLEDARRFIADQRKAVAEEYARFLFRFPTVQADAVDGPVEAAYVIREMFVESEVPV
jgi:hypothetical protein